MENTDYILQTIDVGIRELERNFFAGNLSDNIADVNDFSSYPIYYDYMIRLNNAKAKVIKDISSFGNYTRIRAMSNIEINELRRKDIEEFKEKIDGLKEKNKIIKELYKSLLEKKKQILEQLKVVDEDKRQDLLVELKRINKSIKINSPDKSVRKSYYNLNNRFINYYRSNIKDLEMMSINQLKNMYLKRIDKADEYEKIIRESNKPFDYKTYKLGSIAEDPKKAIRLAHLFRNYFLHTNIMYPIKIDDLPKRFKNQLKNEFLLNNNQCYINNTYLFNKIYDDYLDFFEKNSKAFKRFINGNLLALFWGFDDKIDSKNVDFSFLEQYDDFLDLADLKDCVNRRKLLVAKNKKTQKDMNNLDFLDKAIINEQIVLYREIWNYYDGILNFNIDDCSVYYDDLNSAVNIIKDKIENSNKILKIVALRFRIAKKRIDAKHINNTENAKNVVESISKLLDIDDIDINIFNPNISFDKNLSMISEAGIERYKRKLVLRTLSYTNYQAEKEKIRLLANEDNEEKINKKSL